MLAEMSPNAVKLLVAGSILATAGLTSLGIYWRTRSKAPVKTPECPHHVDMRRQLERGEEKFIRIDEKLDTQAVVQGEMKQSLGRIEGYLEAMK